MAKRRGNGEGSVYRRGDGRIIGEYVDAYGRRRYVSGKTKTEVKAKLRRLLADRDEGHRLRLGKLNSGRLPRQVA